jgi:sugar phosphate permease
MTVIGLIGPAICLLLFCAMKSLLFAVVFVSLSMALCAFNSAGHLSNHADVAPNHAGITFAVSNTLATIPGILCGPLTAELVTQSHGRWFPVFVLAATINFVGAIIYTSQSSASQAL